MTLPNPSPPELLQQTLIPTRPRFGAPALDSLQALENMNLVVTRSEMYTTNWAYIISNKEDKENLKRFKMFLN